MQRIMLLLALLLIGLITSYSLLLAAGKPAPGIHPIVDLNYFEEKPAANQEKGSLFGGSVDGKWVDGDTLMARLKACEQYRIYSTTKFLGIYTADKPKKDPDYAGELAPELTFKLPSGTTRAQTLIGIAGGWNALPRIPIEESVKEPTYQQVVKDYLIKHGIKGAKVNITRILRIDLDGDHSNEVLISATSPNKYILEDSHKGDYSVVLLRKIIKGKAITIPVEEYLYNGEEASQYTLQGAFDVNGDAVMEILVGWKYVSGSGSTIYSVKNNNVLELLRSGGGV